MAGLLHAMSSRELTEWQVYLEAEGRLQALMQTGTDPELAREMVWGPPAEHTR